MNEYVSLQNITDDMGEYAIEGMDNLTDEVVYELTEKGLLSPELCYIAHKILEKYSEGAKKMIDLDKKIPLLIKEADDLLRSLGEK